MSLTEAQATDLVQRARRGERQAFGELVDRYRDMVYGFAYHLTGNFEDARDLTQDALVRAYVRLPQLREPARFAGWLRRIVSNLYRSSARRPAARTLPLEDGHGVALEPSTAREIELTVQAALGSLREHDRLVLTLHYIDGHTQPEISQFLDTSASVVKTRLARARARLREELTEMVEDTLSTQRLPETFREDVIAGVNALVGDLLEALPLDVDELTDSARSRRNAAWRQILAALPEGLRQNVAGQDSASPIPVADFPEEMRPGVRDAMHLTWLLDILLDLRPPPWVVDLEVLWISFGSRPGSTEPTVWIADVPGDSGTIHPYISLTAPTDRATSPVAVTPAPGTEWRDVAQLLASVAQDVTRTARSVRTALLSTLPADAAALLPRLQAEMCASFTLVRERLTAEQREQIPQGKRVAAAHFDERVKSILRQAVALYWAEDIVSGLAEVPAWIEDFGASSVEFGLYPQDPSLGEHFGREYVKVRGPARADQYQTGISQ